MILHQATDFIYPGRKFTNDKRQRKQTQCVKLNAGTKLIGSKCLTIKNENIMYTVRKSVLIPLTLLCVQ